MSYGIKYIWVRRQHKYFMYYVYKFLDKNNNIIYIGKTQNLTRRIREHLNGNGHLDKDCYDEVVNIYYIEFKNINDMNLFEIYCISKYNPKYNTVYLTELTLKFELLEPEWVMYDTDKLNRYKLTPKGQCVVFGIRDENTIKQILEYLENKEYRYSYLKARNYCLFTLGLFAGNYFGDILQLKISDIINKNCKIKNKIAVKRGISDRHTTIELNQQTKTALFRYIKTLDSYNLDDYLFSTRQSKPLSRVQAYRVIKQIEKDLNLDTKLGTLSFRKTAQYNDIRNKILNI